MLKAGGPVGYVYPKITLYFALAQYAIAWADGWRGILFGGYRLNVAMAVG